MSAAFVRRCARGLFAGAFSLSLSGCITQVKPDAPQHPPTASERAAVYQALQLRLFDFDSAKIMSLSTVAEATYNDQPAKVMCVVLNAKNRFGAYVGTSVSVLFLDRNDRVLDMTSNTSLKLCKNLRGVGP